MKNKGLTLIELVITMAILISALILIFQFFKTIYTNYKEKAKLAETAIEKLLVVEAIRKDIEMAGFGVPYDISGITYTESATSIPCDDSNNPPRAICMQDNTGPNNSDYLVIKSTYALITNSGARKTAYLFANGTNWIETPISPENFTSTDYFIILDPEAKKLQLVRGKWMLKLDDINGLTTSDNFTGNANPNKIYVLYGIMNTTDNLQTSTYKKPFNRADYYLENPDTRPQRCAPFTYELYRANISQVDGTKKAKPILDCVLDFQLAFGIDTNNDTQIDTWISDISGYSYSDIKNKIKQVQAYLVYQLGKKSKQKIFTNSKINLVAPDNSIIKTLDLSSFPDHEYYRWKIVKITAIPVNLEVMER